MGVCRNVCIFHANYVVLQQTVSEQCKDKEVFGVALCICLHSAFLPDDCSLKPRANGLYFIYFFQNITSYFIFCPFLY